MKNHDFKYFASEAFHGLKSHAFMTFAAIGIITACLLIMGSFTLVAVNLEKNLGQLEQENEFLAYVDETLSDAEAQALEGQIAAVENVASVTFITRAEAKENYLAQQEQSALFEELPDTVFRHRYAIRVNDITRMAETVDRVEEINGVADVQAALAIAQGFVTVRNVATAIAVILIAILLVISLFIISNTIKLATFARRDEIAIMKMVGATDGFIRMPFVYEGVVLGVAGAAIAFFLQWGIYQLIVKAVHTGGQIQLFSLIEFGAIAPQVALIFLATGLIVGVGGSLVTIRKFLQV